VPLPPVSTDDDTSLHPPSANPHPLASPQELFFQLEGDMCLEVFEHGQPKSIPIRQGEIFLLPGRIPHSPQRKAGTVGLVTERERLPEEKDGLRWYTRDATGRVLYEEWFHCTDLGVQLAPVIQRFMASECFKSGVEPAPGVGEGQPPIVVDTARSLHPPIVLADWIATHAAAGGHAVLYGEGAVEPSLREQEYTVDVFTRTVPGNRWCGGGGAGGGGVLLPAGEIFIYQMSGGGVVHVTDTHAGAGSAAGAAGSVPGEGVQTFPLASGDVMLIPGGGRYRVRLEWPEAAGAAPAAAGGSSGTAALVITNKVARV
jgi:3-hydroxyanthranilate 3,4-dioxygenase